MAPQVETFSSATVKVNTPDGKMFVNIMEDQKGKPVQILVTIGKAGLSAAAWSDALSRLINMSLRSGKDLEDIVVELSSITTSSWRQLNDGVMCRSGPEGIVIALMKYRNSKVSDESIIQLNNKLIDLSRPARMYNR